MRVTAAALSRIRPAARSTTSTCISAPLAMCSVAEAISSPLVLICCVVAENPAADPLSVPALAWIWLTTMRSCSSIV